MKAEGAPCGPVSHAQHRDLVQRAVATTKEFRTGMGENQTQFLLPCC